MYWTIAQRGCKTKEEERSCMNVVIFVMSFVSQTSPTGGCLVLYYLLISLNEKAEKCGTVSLVIVNVTQITHFIASSYFLFSDGVLQFFIIGVYSMFYCIQCRCLCHCHQCQFTDVYSVLFAVCSAGVCVTVTRVSLSTCTVYFLLCAMLEFMSLSLGSVYQRVQCTFLLCAVLEFMSPSLVSVYQCVQCTFRFVQCWSLNRCISAVCQQPSTMRPATCTVTPLHIWPWPSEWNSFKTLGQLTLSQSQSLMGWGWRGVGGGIREWDGLSTVSVSFPCHDIFIVEVFT